MLRNAAALAIKKGRLARHAVWGDGKILSGGGGGGRDQDRTASGGEQERISYFKGHSGLALCQDRRVRGLGRKALSIGSKGNADESNRCSKSAAGIPKKGNRSKRGRRYRGQAKKTSIAVDKQGRGSVQRQREKAKRWSDST